MLQGQTANEMRQERQDRHVGCYPSDLHQYDDIIYKKIRTCERTLCCCVGRSSIRRQQMMPIEDTLGTTSSMSELQSPLLPILCQASTGSRTGLKNRRKNMAKKQQRESNTTGVSNRVRVNSNITSAKPWWFLLPAIVVVILLGKFAKEDTFMFPRDKCRSRVDCWGKDAYCAISSLNDDRCCCKHPINGKCPNIIPEGQPCWIKDDFMCRQDTTCRKHIQINDTGDMSTVDQGVCVKKMEVGGPCVVKKDCADFRMSNYASTNWTHIDCVSEICSLVAAPRAGEPCNSTSRCINNNVCGRTSYHPGDTSSSGICCVNGASTYVDSDGRSTWYCESSIPLGSACPPERYESRGRPNVCVGSPPASCIMKTCQAKKLDVGMTCMFSRDCESGLCGHLEWNVSLTKVCCDSQFVLAVTVNYTEYANRNYIKMCPNSIPEGYQCPLQFPSDYDYHAGSLCSNGTMCISGVCQRELAPAGSQCWLDSECLNGQCGRTSYTGVRSSQNLPVCCPSGRKRLIHGESSAVVYCDRSIPNGQPCPPAYSDTFSDSICESNSSMCVGGICSQERLESGEQCFRKEDCKNEACGKGLNLYDESGRHKTVCCPSGTLGLKASAFCSGIVPTNQPCRYKDPSLCEGGFCVQNYCANELRRPNESCLQHVDCADASCGFNRWDSHNRRKLCCPSKRTLTDTDQHEICTAIIPCGELCFDDAVCLEGFTCGSGGICE